MPQVVYGCSRNKKLCSIPSFPKFTKEIPNKYTAIIWAKKHEITLPVAEIGCKLCGNTGKKIKESIWQKHAKCKKKNCGHSQSQFNGTFFENSHKLTHKNSIFWIVVSLKSPHEKHCRSASVVKRNNNRLRWIFQTIFVPKQLMRPRCLLVVMKLKLRLMNQNCKAEV